MTRAFYISFFVLILSTRSTAQEFNLGAVYGFNVIQKTTLDLPYYSPSNSYHTYIESSPGAGLINKTSPFNGLHVGGAVNFIYKRLGLYLEPQFYYQRSVITFQNPVEISRVFGKRGFRMPFYFTYKFFKKERSIYSILGLSLSKEKNWDFQDPGTGFYLGSDPIFDGNFDTGDDHFRDVLYNNQAYWNLVAGFGRKIGKVNASVRYVIPMSREKKGLSGDIWTLEMSFNFFFLSTREINKKHHLYAE
ncbi:MAG: hypothetical protein R2780_04405 [Crocinitomicaceae bacterium]